MRLHRVAWLHCIRHRCTSHRIPLLWAMANFDAYTHRTVHRYFPKSTFAKWSKHRHSLRKNNNNEKEHTQHINIILHNPNTSDYYLIAVSFLSCTMWTNFLIMLSICLGNLCKRLAAISLNTTHLPFWMTFLQTARRSNWLGGGGAHSM